jgi:hypothetical protein
MVIYWFYEHARYFFNNLTQGNITKSEDTFSDTWFRFLSSTVHFPATIRNPGGGDVGGFTYQPYTKWEAPALMRGDDAVEQPVYR